MKRVLRFLRDRWLTADPRSLALFRIWFGTCLLVDLLRRLPVMTAFYTNEGVLANHFALFRPPARWIFSIYYLFSTPSEVAVAFFLTAVIYLMYIVGYKTRLAQVLAFICVSGLHNRNIMLENGGDVVMNIVACWAVLMPLGRRFSVDALIASWRARDEHSPGELNDRRPPVTTPVVSLIVFAFALEFAIIYAFNAGNKIGNTWRNGSAIYWVLHQERLITPFGRWAGLHAPYGFLRLLTWGTLGIEAAAPFLYFFPWKQRWLRWAGLATLWGLHLGIGVTTNIKLFQLSMMSFPLTMIMAADWAAFGERHKRRTGNLTVVYDTDCGICHQSAKLLKRLDPLAQLDFVGNDDDARRPADVSRELADRTVVVIDAAGRKYTRAAAFARIFRTLPGWAPLGWFMRVPGIHQSANVVYDLVARNRHRISARLGLGACGIAPPQPVAGAMAAGGQTTRRFDWLRAIVREGLVVMLIVALGSQVLTENRGPARIFQIHQPDWMAAVVQYPRLFQGWGMFAPDAPTDDGTLVIDAKTVSGRHVDPITWREPILAVVPPGGLYPMQPQWCDYANRIRQPGNFAYRQGLRDYLLRVAEIDHRPPQDHIVSFEAWWVSRRTPAPGETTLPPVAKDRILSFP